jgi:hypothetical protein
VSSAILSHCADAFPGGKAAATAAARVAPAGTATATAVAAMTTARSARVLIPHSFRSKLIPLLDDDYGALTFAETLLGFVTGGS